MARQQCKKAVSEPELATDLEEVPIRKRKRKIPILDCERSESDKTNIKFKLNFAAGIDAIRHYNTLPNNI